MPAARPDWAGRTVVCIASGPSLTQEDCNATKGHPTIVTNTSFRMAPWADIVFGFDSRWWRSHIAEVREVFSGRLISASQVAVNLGVESTFGSDWFRQYANSGACAISIAIGAGASKVVLLGFDCQNGPNGEKHWHGSHPAGLSNCASMARWSDVFKRVSADAKAQGVPVLNATRRTALKCFQKVELTEALCEQSAVAPA